MSFTQNQFHCIVQSIVLYCGQYSNCRYRVHLHSAGKKNALYSNAISWHQRELWAEHLKQKWKKSSDSSKQTSFDSSLRASTRFFCVQADSAKRSAANCIRSDLVRPAFSWILTPNASSDRHELKRENVGLFNSYRFHARRRLNYLQPNSPTCNSHQTHQSTFNCNQIEVSGSSDASVLRVTTSSGLRDAGGAPIIFLWGKVW